MSSKVIDKIMNFLGIEEEEVETSQQSLMLYDRKPKVVNIHTNPQIKMLISKPEKFEQVLFICNELKSKKPVIVDLQKMDKSEAQRVVDFLSGAVYALNGEITKISGYIFLVAPENFDITGDIKEEVNALYNLN
ncbi:cell division protein SepF [Caldanaerobacter sp.]|uniref:cell division protein SepF n=1 Tax=Caldanaerobacter sp. TaxID=2930036 RepID=UPI003C731DA2